MPLFPCTATSLKSGRAPTDVGPAAVLQKTRRGPGHSSSVDIWAILPSAVRDIAMLKVRPANVAR
jgi:hypothetical protein